MIGVPQLPQEMARRGYRSVGYDIQRAVDLAARQGASIVGLGGYTTPYSRRGLEVVGRGPAITTGNSLTAGMATQAIVQTALHRGVRLSESTVAVVGAHGSIGTLCVELLARERPYRLVLIGRPGGSRAVLSKLAERLAYTTIHVDIATDLSTLGDCDIVLSATGAGRPILPDDVFAPGAIVCDVARPPDTYPTLRARTDITFIEGGCVALPDPHTQFGIGNLGNLPAGVTLACLAETIVLSLAREKRDVGVGYDVPVQHVDHVMALTNKHGFYLAPLTTKQQTPTAPVNLPLCATKGAAYAY